METNNKNEEAKKVLTDAVKQFINKRLVLTQKHENEMLLLMKKQYEVNKENMDKLAGSFPEFNTWVKNIDCKYFLNIMKPLITSVSPTESTKHTFSSNDIINGLCKGIDVLVRQVSELKSANKKMDSLLKEKEGVEQPLNENFQEEVKWTYPCWGKLKHSKLVVRFSKKETGIVVISDEDNKYGDYCGYWRMKFFEPCPNPFEPNLKNEVLAYEVTVANKDAEIKELKDTIKDLESHIDFGKVLFPLDGENIEKPILTKNFDSLLIIDSITNLIATLGSNESSPNWFEDLRKSITPNIEKILKSVLQ